jgi:hypothetical protein
VVVTVLFGHIPVSELELKNALEFGFFFSELLEGLMPIVVFIHLPH